MKRLATIAMFLMMALSLLAAPAAARPGDNGSPGNSGAAHACQGDGYLDYTRADGSSFANSDECASYGAEGGMLVEATEGGGNEGGGEESGGSEASCSDFATLAPAGNPADAFDSEQDCIDYIEAGNTPASLDSDSDGIPDVDEANDADNDGAEDGSDNCPAMANPGQADIDGDGIGDACDDDRDGDGVNNANDVWPDDPNRAHDSDTDSVADGADNCPALANPGQADIDNDGIGDVCDAVDDSGFSTDQTVTLSNGSNCTLVVSVSGFEPGTYDGTLSTSGITFSITVGDGGTGSSAPIGNSVVLTSGATYTATVDGIVSDGYELVCSVPVPVPEG